MSTEKKIILNESDFDTELDSETIKAVDSVVNEIDNGNQLDNT